MIQSSCLMYAFLTKRCSIEWIYRSTDNHWFWMATHHCCERESARRCLRCLAVSAGSILGFSFLSMIMKIVFLWTGSAIEKNYYIISEGAEKLYRTRNSLPVVPAWCGRLSHSEGFTSFPHANFGNRTIAWNKYLISSWFLDLTPPDAYYKIIYIWNKKNSFSREFTGNHW